MARGACNCGEIAFELDLTPTDIYICHCSICRRATGSNGVAVIVVDNQQFRWTRGEQEIHTWKKPDADWQTWFCRHCGSPVPGHNDDQRMFVPVGLITEGGDELKVKHHIWTASKAGWDEICDQGKLHTAAFEG